MSSSHTWSTDEQRAQVRTAAREAMRKIMTAVRGEQREWERLRVRAEAALEDAPTLVRELPEITAVHRLRRERAWLDSAARPVSAYERAHFARQGVRCG